MDRFMNMTSGVTSTVSNWWSKPNAESNGKQNEDNQQPPSDNATTTTTSSTLLEEGNTNNAEVKGNEEDEDSPPTSEADSVSNQSEIGGETPLDEKQAQLDEKQAQIEGDDKGKSFVGGVQVGINEVSTKAIESAKSLGSFLFSVANKAGKTVTETAKHIKHTVEENSILGEFNKEQETFLKDKNTSRTEAAVPPWVGYAEEDIMKQQILSLSLDRRNFLRSPPSGVQFQFDYAAMHPIALATLAEDPNLEKIRFELVPKLVSEENFWQNYFYRVSLIKQSTQLSSLAQENSSTGGDSSNSNHSSRKSSVEDSTKITDGDGRESPSHEFVSDAYQSNVLNREELRKEMKQLGMKDNEEEWEKEVQQELQEYEVVMGGSSHPVDDNEWEEEIQQMLDAEITKT